MDSSRPGTTREWIALFVILFVGYYLTLFYVSDILLKALAFVFLPHAMHSIVIGNLGRNSVFYLHVLYNVVVGMPRAVVATGAALNADGDVHAAMAAVATAQRQRRLARTMPGTFTPPPEPHTGCRCHGCECRPADVERLERQLREARLYAYETSELARSSYDRLNDTINRLLARLVSITPASAHGGLVVLRSRIANLRETLLFRKRELDRLYLRARQTPPVVPVSRS